MVEQFAYAGRDLEAMLFAENYHNWILQLFKPFLGKHLVEVGAGIGSFSELILNHIPCETLALVEPSEALASELFARTAYYRQHRDITIYKSTFIAAAPKIREKQPPDSIIYVNVLEHISDDEHELRVIHQTLPAGGRLFLFVPAFDWLYGSFDEAIGHQRRYTKKGLKEKLKRIGFRPLRSCYFDLLGIVPWWISFRLLKTRELNSDAVKLYDKFVVPLSARFEGFLPPPLGKNVLLIAEKS